MAGLIYFIKIKMSSKCLSILKKLPKTCQFWNLKLQLRHYLNTQINEQNVTNQYKMFAIAIILIFFASSLLATLDTFSPLTRLIQTDPCLFLHLPPTMNWIFLLFATDNLLFYIGMYNNNKNEALNLVWLVLYNRKQATIFFSIKPYFCSKNAKMLLIIARRYTKRCILVMQYFVAFVGIY